MKKNLIKTMVAATCVIATGMGGMKAYNAANPSQANMLLMENVEALSAGGEVIVDILCRESPGDKCYLGDGLRALNAKRIA